VPEPSDRTPPAPAPPTSLETERLVLRRWRDEDLGPFAALNADPVVMATLPAVLTRAESGALVARTEASFDERGHGLWAVEERATGRHVGFVGLAAATFPASFTPAVEVGWRLAAAHWGRGFATEAARVAVTDGFDRLGLPEIVSFTAVVNERSRRVMERLGMTRDPSEDFDHPSLSEGHHLRRHVLYRLRPEDTGRP
jgi:RimJ/RimL family protein N-acetyltransferase